MIALKPPIDSFAINLPTENISFLHRSYPDNQNVLLTLPAVDKSDGTHGVLHGIHHETARIACAILANCHWEGYFCATRDGSRVDAGPDELLSGKAYYFYIDGDPDYAVVPSIDHFQFPNLQGLPQSWLSSPDIVDNTITSGGICIGCGTRTGLPSCPRRSIMWVAREFLLARFAIAILRTKSMFARLGAGPLKLVIYEAETNSYGVRNMSFKERLQTFGPTSSRSKSRSASPRKKKRAADQDGHVPDDLDVLLDEQQGQWGVISSSRPKKSSGAMAQVPAVGSVTITSQNHPGENNVRDMIAVTRMFIEEDKTITQEIASDLVSSAGPLPERDSSSPSFPAISKSEKLEEEDYAWYSTKNCEHQYVTIKVYAADQEQGERELAALRHISATLVEVGAKKHPGADQANVVHADIQEGNVMFSIESEGELRELEELELSDPLPRKVHKDGHVIFATRSVSADIEWTNLYRAPEILLGYPWTNRIGIWALGLMMWGMIEGKNLFDDNAGGRWKSALPHIARMISLLGPPPQHMLNGTAATKDYFDKRDKCYPDEKQQLIEENTIVNADRHMTSQTGQLRKGRKVIPTSLEAEGAKLEDEKEEFVHFISQMLQWDPEKQANGRGTCKRPMAKVGGR
ncbi:Serine/threonine-protein kinase SKY1 [Cytospora mali]|uniref:Serine/threonine-protein kinase SKY1 n=1 Tax=Cytospora mali TaxID=578113 RepID=A0A194UZP2_CYTMA|nr:Serine/threonine-protein kinase SKY1 [Valsa mali var. pyri (nom. inval.)]